VEMALEEDWHGRLKKESQSYRLDTTTSGIAGEFYFFRKFSKAHFQSTKINFILLLHGNR